MSIETLCPPLEDSDRLKKINPFIKPTVQSVFGNPLEAVKPPNPDLRIPSLEIGAIIIKHSPTNPEIETAKKVIEVKLDRPEAEEVTGKQIAFSVAPYRTLYNQILEATGDKELAGVDTYRAILRDGTSFIQESITAQKNKNGDLIISDPVFQAKAQQTATFHTFMQTKNPEGKMVITSPEYLETGKSITETISGWRRSNDHSAISLVENLVNNLPEDPQGKDITLMWASPRAEEWEDEWVRKYNIEYGYQYVGRLTGAPGARRLLVHSYKADAKTETLDSFMNGHQGEVYRAGFEDEKERPFLDKLMRSVKVIRGVLSGTEVIKGLYKAKQEVEGSDKMFGILENTMLFAQDETLRQRIEREASSPVAHWLVRQISLGTPDNILQEQVIGKFTNETVSLMEKYQQEEQERESAKTMIKAQPSNPLNLPSYKIEQSPFSDDRALLMADLQRRTQTAGAFCGELGGTSIDFGSNPIQDIIANYSGISGMRINTIGGGGLSSGEVTHCKKCGDHLCGTGKCGKCNIKY